jgi:site-specific DNA-methyltransferase (adenine-specific)
MTVRDVLEGRARWHVHHGEALAFLRSLPDESVNALITDPPYSSGGAFRSDRAGRTSKKYVSSDVIHVRPEFLGDNRDARSFLLWCTLWLSECLRIAKAGAPACVFADRRQLPMMTDALQAGGWVWRGIAVWDKTEAARPSYGRFRAQCEYIVWGSKGPMPTTRIAGVLPGCFRHPVLQRDKHHMTGKPSALVREVVAICAPNSVVLDPFAGSATTGTAALAEGHRFLGAELSTTYHATSAARLAAAVRELFAARAA